jgi:hypothetical protein
MSGTEKALHIHAAVFSIAGVPRAAFPAGIRKFIIA